MTSPAELQDRILQSNERYFSVLADIPADRLENDQVCGHWSARDVTLHLADWGDLQLAGIDQALNGTPLDDYPLADPDGFNDIQAESYGEISWDDARERLNAVTVQAADLAGSLTEGQLQTQATAPWGSTETIEDILATIYGHQDEHTADFEGLAT